MLKQLKTVLPNSFAAGLCIGIGGTVYLSCDNQYIGALLFSVALLTICFLGCHLFTGKVGGLVNAHGKSDFISIIFCLLGNLLGTGFCALLSWGAKPSLQTVAEVMCRAKLSRMEGSFLAIFCAAVLCGILMYVAVTVYRVKNNSVIGILFCVPVFILAGFEHSIADMFYFWVSGIYTWQSAGFLALVVLGNSAGGCLIPAIKRIAGETI